MKIEALNSEGISAEDENYQGSLYSEVKKAIFANPYQKVWGAVGEAPLPHYDITAREVYRGFMRGKADHFKQAAIRTVRTCADLRWGDVDKGFRKIIHTNGVALTGTWEISEDNEFSGYFKKGSKGLIISRISCGSSAIMQGTPRAFGFAGKLYPTMDENHTELLKPASFFALDKLSGCNNKHITDVTMTNGLAVKILGTSFPSKLMLLRAGILFGPLDVQGTIRQVYQIAELGKADSEATNTPQFMCLTATEGQPTINEDDFRNELLAHIFDKGNPTPQRTLSFDINVSNDGKAVGNAVTGSSYHVTDWKKIGTIIFDNAVASYNSDFVLHFPHPRWRTDRNDPDTVVHKENL